MHEHKSIFYKETLTSRHGKRSTATSEKDQDLNNNARTSTPGAMARNSMILIAFLLTVISNITNIYASPCLLNNTALQITKPKPKEPNDQIITSTLTSRDPNDNSVGHCDFQSCPSGDAAGHQYCRNVGCDYCVANLRDWAAFHCDGRRGLLLDEALTDEQTCA